MLTYWLVFIVVASAAMTHLRPVLVDTLRSSWWGPSWLAIFASLTLLIGLRHEVGADWEPYLGQLEMVSGDSLYEAIGKGDPAYYFLNWFGANIWGGIYFINSIAAALFSWGLLTFCRAQPRPWLALTVAVSYLTIVVAMGYTRQGVAIGLALVGLTALIRGSVSRFAIWIVIAALFHMSAAILLLLVVFIRSKNRLLTLMGVVALGALLFVLRIQESIESLSYIYFELEYDSSGALIRVAMNTLPAILFLVFRERFIMDIAQRKLWSWIAISALGFIPLLMVSPSTAAVDRLALYWVPLQLFVWSRLPDVLGRTSHHKLVLVYGVVGYSAFVLFVWLFFAGHAYAWLPYQFYPWVWLWS